MVLSVVGLWVTYFLIFLNIYLRGNYAPWFHHTMQLQCVHLHKRPIVQNRIWNWPNLRRKFYLEIQK